MIEEFWKIGHSFFALGCHRFALVFANERLNCSTPKAVKKKKRMFYYLRKKSMRGIKTKDISKDLRMSVSKL